MTPSRLPAKLSSPSIRSTSAFVSMQLSHALWIYPSCAYMYTVRLTCVRLQCTPLSCLPMSVQSVCPQIDHCRVYLCLYMPYIEKHVLYPFIKTQGVRDSSVSKGLGLRVEGRGSRHTWAFSRISFSSICRTSSSWSSASIFVLRWGQWGTLRTLRYKSFCTSLLRYKSVWVVIAVCCKVFN